MDTPDTVRTDCSVYLSASAPANPATVYNSEDRSLRKSDSSVSIKCIVFTDTPRYLKNTTLQECCDLLGKCLRHNVNPDASQ